MKEISSEPNEFNDSDDISENTVSDTQLELDIKALDQIIERQEAIKRDREKIKKRWIARGKSWNYIPFFSSAKFLDNPDYDASWEELWYLVGTYLSEAISQYETEIE